MEASPNEQQAQHSSPSKPRARGDWEFFWRIVAGLMLLVIAWVAWVLYQITPRSVVTPLAYAGKIRPLVQPQSASGVAATVAPAVPAASAAPATPAPSSLPTAAAMSPPAQTAGPAASTSQAQSTPPAKSAGEIKSEGLRLATEISLPPSAGPTNPAVKPGAPSASATGGAGGKSQP